MGVAPGVFLDPDELAAFVAAVESGSVGAAADALELTQSAASKRLAGLERRLGTTLLERGRFGVRATDAGRLLYPEAKQALSALSHAAAVVSAHSAPAPALRLAASHTTGGFLLPGWLAGFRGGRPAMLRAHVEIVNSQTVLDHVRSGRADLGFIESLDDTGELDELTILQDEIVAVVAAGHPWARQRAVRAQQLRAVPYFAREAGSGTRSVVTLAIATAGLPALEPTLEVASAQSLKRAVLGGGFTLMSRLAVEEEVLAGTLRALPVADLDLTRPLRAVRRPRSGAGGDVGRFWAYLATLRSS